MCLDFVLIQEAGTGRGRDGALAAFSGKGNIFVNDIPTSVPDKGHSARARGTTVYLSCSSLPQDPWDSGNAKCLAKSRI